MVGDKVIKFQKDLADKNVTREIIQLLTSTGANVKNLVSAIKLAYNISTAAEDVTGVSVHLVTRLISNLPRMINNVSIVLNIFGVLLSVAEIKSTLKSVKNGSKSEYTEQLEIIVEQMEFDLESSELRDLSIND